MKNSINADLKTWVYSGRVLIMLLLFVFVFALSVRGSYSSFVLGNKFFLGEERQSAKEDCYDEYIMTLTDPDAETLYNKEFLIMKLKTTESHLHALNPEHALSYCIEMGYYFFPILLVIFGALTIKSDMSSNLMRHRVAREGRWNFFFGKQIVLFGVTILCFVIGTLIDYIDSYITYDHVTKQPIFYLIDVAGSKYPNMGNSIVSIVFFFFFILLFSEMGFCVGLITKSVIIPTVITLVLFYILPIYKYSPVNALRNVFSKLSDFQGIINCSAMFEINTSVAWLIISMLLIIPYTVAVIVYKYRSAYK